MISKGVEYLGINLTKEVKQLHNENYKTAENKEDIDKSHIYGLEDTSNNDFLKYRYYLKRSIGSVQSLSKSQ